MVYASLIVNAVLLAAIARLWLDLRDRRFETERTAREFELMMQAHQAELRTELLQAHSLLMEANQRIQLLEATGENREDPEAARIAG